MQNCTGAWAVVPNPGRTHTNAAWTALFLVGECAVVMRNALTVLVKGLGRKLQKAGITSGHQQQIIQADAETRRMQAQTV